MAINKISCPCCGAVLKPASPVAPGKKIKCPKCTAVFAVEPELPEAPLQKPASRPRTAPSSNEIKEPRALASDKPRPQAAPKKMLRREEPEEDWEQDWEERPAAQKIQEKTKKGGSLLLIGGICAGVLLLIGLSTTAAVVAWRSLIGPAKGSGEIVLPKGYTKAAVQTAFDDWLQDPEAAKQRAAGENKDLLLFFTHSDTDRQAIQMTDQVLSQAEFRDKIKPHFVLVFVDIPFSAAAKAKVQDAARNQQLLKDYQVVRYPALILADGQGQPYTILPSYEESAAGVYADQLIALREQRNKRDQLQSKLATGQGAGKLATARELLKLIQENHVLQYYEPMLHDWTELARAQDPKNEQGTLEVFFEAEWSARVSRDGPTLVPRPGQTAAQESTKLAALLDEWKKTCRFKDADRAARLYLEAGSALAAAGKPEVAAKYYLEGLADKRSPELRQRLGLAAAALQIKTGTGFAVAPGGYILTNFHVAGGPGRVLVRLNTTKEPVAAQVVAQDEQRDIALLRVTVPAGLELRPLSLGVSRQPSRGDQVAVLGYPLGDMVGSGLKLTTGVVSATPEAGSGDMMVLDAKVNPGNSGGPLCDPSGNVVGMITAKSFGGGTIDSYGMARPAQDLENFLKKNLKDYKPAPGEKAKMAWNEVDRLVSASVLMVLKTPQ